MITEIKDFKRKDLFEHYHSCTNPFIIVTTKIKVTNVVNYCSTHKNFYPTLGFLITKTVNQNDAFKYRHENGKIYFCDEIKSNYTQRYANDTIGYYTIPAIQDFDEYITKYLEIQKKFLEDSKYTVENNLDEVWLSCLPWMSFTGLVPPFNKEISIPQFIWDKYEKVGDDYYLNLMIMVHHGFADGYHVGKFVTELQENINSFNN